MFFDIFGYFKTLAYKSKEEMFLSLSYNLLNIIVKNFI